MNRLIIEGGCQLRGDIRCSGAKNSALPILAASLLARGSVHISNLPHLQDVTTMLELLGRMGTDVIHDEDMSVEVNSSTVRELSAPVDLVRTMRASILVLGPMLSRFGEATVAMPGGCAIGTRPVDQHIRALRQMGAEITETEEHIHARTGGHLRGAEITMELVTVTGTENVMMAATLAEGRSVIRNAACEPEVADLARCLNSWGARISGHGTDTIEIEGVKHLHGGEYAVMSDRIELGTYLAAAAMTRGCIEVFNAQPEHAGAVLDALRSMGAEIDEGEHSVRLDMKGRRPRSHDLTTAPFPAFPTDMQAQFVAVNCVAEGSARIQETVFENRFMHVQELRRMGAQIELQDNAVYVEGSDELHGSHVEATDLRASACLVLAGLAARGQTLVDNVHHIDRGYECIEEKFNLLGAEIQRTEAVTP
ncbi:MAG: UDP-N-acetylglucosamine 1-carboxyvinyltransferase [Gammaproteobacteria bacterium AqS3]|nr:UDP-N-acetylglucosamine 1-carboxyvinyltransferase [Gammaproteobacteria bacterium AqS3]